MTSRADVAATLGGRGQSSDASIRTQDLLIRCHFGVRPAQVLPSAKRSRYSDLGMTRSYLRDGPCPRLPMREPKPTTSGCSLRSFATLLQRLIDRFGRPQRIEQNGELSSYSDHRSLLRILATADIDGLPIGTQ